VPLWAVKKGTALKCRSLPFVPGREGNLFGTMAVCAGTAEQAPGVSFELTLMPSKRKSNAGADPLSLH
jgi:hypothetical protein